MSALAAGYRVRNRAVALAALCLWLLVLAAPAFGGGPGFRSRHLLDEHFEKHGREFGAITEQHYLQMAQQLRDARASANIMQSKRTDGIISRFDRKHGYFGAYNPDGTIRTFFIPADGARYFERQARRDGHRLNNSK